MDCICKDEAERWIQYQQDGNIAWDTTTMDRERSMRFLDRDEARIYCKEIQKKLPTFSFKVFAHDNGFRIRMYRKATHEFVGYVREGYEL